MVNTPDSPATEFQLWFLVSVNLVIIEPEVTAPVT